MNYVIMPTCHWCHVMEEESFCDEEIGAYLNRHFISIKVDREKRPDIDAIYMDVCQMLTGSGGWPLSVFMDADKNAFYAGTYFPKASRYGIMGFMDLLQKIAGLYQKDRAAVTRAGREIQKVLQSGLLRKKGEVDDDIAGRLFSQLLQQYDHEYGGFSKEPKFPTPHVLSFLLHYAAAGGDKRAVEMVENTLLSMVYGGIYDHIGYGFCRYATDRYWLVPHFEKMLYDNAGLIQAYAYAYQCTKNELLKKAVEDTICYILRDMRADNGGFYSAEDADSEGVEGKFYCWDYDEVQDILREEDAEAFCSLYNITPTGNFEGSNIPNLRFGTGRGDIHVSSLMQMEKARLLLYHEREKRIHPLKDKKIITAWNGMMISALAVAADILDRDEYRCAAKTAAQFVMDSLTDKEGLLYHDWYEGQVSGHGFASDYVFFIEALLHVYECCFEPVYLQKALAYADRLIQHFWDEEHGGFFITRKDGEKLPVRQKEYEDGAIPSDNSVAAVNFIKLSRLTGDYHLLEIADRILQSYAQEMNQAPLHFVNGVTAAVVRRHPSKEIIIACEEKGKTEGLLEKIKKGFHPFVTVLLCTADTAALSAVAPIAKNIPLSDKALAYVCEGSTCHAPVEDIRL